MWGIQTDGQTEATASGVFDILAIYKLDYYYYYYYYYYYLAHQHKAAGMKIKLSKNNNHNGVSHGVKCSQEGDCIPPLESNGQSLEQEHRLSCVFCGCSDASANVLDQLNGGLVPGASSLNCHWTKVERLLLLLLIA